MKHRIAIVTLVGAIALVSLAAVFATRGPGATSVAASGCVPGALSQVTVDASRPHRVGTGAQTSYVFAVTNPGPGVANAQIFLSGVTPDWTAVLSPADVAFRPTAPGQGSITFANIGAGQVRRFVALVLPGPDVPEGDLGGLQINAALSNGQNGCLQVAAEHNNTPKVYVIGIDGFSTNYMFIGRDGEPSPAPGNLLTPRLRELLGSMAWFPQGRASLPSSTDMNVFGALSGSWPGTAGLSSVGVFFKGWDQNGNPVTGPLSAADLRYGATGDRALSIFDVAQDPAYGGDPGAFTAMISGKFQTDALFRLGPAYTADLVVDGEVRPYYLSVPQPYLLGDPPSDSNAATDRDGVNLQPPEQYRMIPFGVGNAGNDPLKNPEDRWIAVSALRLIAAEDPDVMVVHFASTDKIQHAAGAANIPSEWSNNGTPTLIWDDINQFNRNANREPTLDVVYEADLDTGLITDELARRGVLSSSYLYLYSDHAGTTYLNADIPLQQVLSDAGVLPLVRHFSGAAEISTIYLWDPANANTVATALEAYTLEHPVWGSQVQPLAAITQAEMDAGIDSRLGFLGRDGGPSRGEMYSQWLIEFPVDDNSKVVWPDIYALARYRFEITVPNILYSVLGGHSGKTTMGALLAVRGPQINPGIYTGADVSLVDVMPTFYQLLGWTAPGNVDGRVLTEVLGAP